MSYISSQSLAEAAVKRLATQRQIMALGQISCWTLGDYRLSVLDSDGLMRKSPNVKKEDIRIATLSPHFALLTFRLTGKDKGYQSTGRVLWRGYRRIAVTIYEYHARMPDWAINMTLQSSAASREFLDTSQSICLRTVYLTPSGLKVGDACVIPNLFQNLSESELRRLFYSLKKTGDDWRNWQLLYDRLETLHYQSANSALKVAMS